MTLSTSKVALHTDITCFLKNEPSFPGKLSLMLSLYVKEIKMFYNFYYSLSYLVLVVLFNLF